MIDSKRIITRPMLYVLKMDELKGLQFKSCAEGKYLVHLICDILVVKNRREQALAWHLVRVGY